MQIVPAIRGAQLMGYINGTVTAPPAHVDGKKEGDPQVLNPAYTEWRAKDHQVFRYIVSSILRYILAQVASFAHARLLWHVFEEMFVSWAMNIDIALATTKKGALTIAEYERSTYHCRVHREDACTRRRDGDSRQAPG